jgi:hypothetical protein
MPWWKNINRHLGTISIVSGALLIIVGVLILTDNLPLVGGLARMIDPYTALVVAAWVAAELAVLAMSFGLHEWCWRRDRRKIATRKEHS